MQLKSNKEHIPVIEIHLIHFQFRRRPSFVYTFHTIFSALTIVLRILKVYLKIELLSTYV